MAKPKYPDHAGRMPGHPRYGNPSDPNEESARIAGANKNLEDWAARNGGSFSGGVSMQYGSGKKYEVPIGDRQIAQKIVSRPIEPPKETPLLERANLIGDNWRDAVRAANIETEVAPPVKKQVSWLRRTLNRLFGE